MARAIFSPKMIINGEIQPEAFRLRSTIKEEYLSVMRISIPTWIEDIKGIPQRKNRKLYGFAELNVGDVRNIRLKGIDYDVRECSLETFASHAGIFISVNGEKLIGGNLISTIVNDVEQDFLILAIQRELVELAQKGLYVV